MHRLRKGAGEIADGGGGGGTMPGHQIDQRAAHNHAIGTGSGNGGYHQLRDMPTALH